MLKISSIVLSVLLALSIAGCSSQPSQGNEPSTSAPSVPSVPSVPPSSEAYGKEGETVGDGAADNALLEPVIESYYFAQSSRASGMLKKNIFKGLLDGWTDDEIKNPVWNYDSFTAYDILDRDGNSTTRGAELYYCTFSADHGKSGYVVVAYTGDGLSRIDLAETPYLFDFQAKRDELAALLSEAGIDFSSAEASRVRLTDGGQNSSQEAIRITDGKGHDVLCYFEESGIRLADHTAP